jgi:hypothetical protein
MSFGFPRDGFLNWVGLHHRGSANGSEHNAQLVEAAIDPHTGGAVAVMTDAVMDGNDGVKTIESKFWRMLPNGKWLTQKLFEIKLKQGEAYVPAADGSGMVKEPTLVPTSVWVLGRNKVYDQGDNPEGKLDNIARALDAVGAVNKEMRRGKLPNVAEILQACNVPHVTGENMRIAGLTPTGEFDFDSANAQEAVKGGKLTVPTAVAQALMGFYINTLDEDHKLEPVNKRVTSDSRTGTRFMAEARVKEGENPEVLTSIRPISISATDPTHHIPCLTNIAWKSAGTDIEGTPLSSLENLNVLGEDLTKSFLLTLMRGMGVTGDTIHDVREGEYPFSMDHLIKYDLYDLIYNFKMPPKLADGGRLTMVSVGGNNMEEIAQGFGETIGGNSKVLYHEGLDEHGKLSRVGVIIDLGLHLSPRDEPNISAAPDVTEHLRHCNDILITHRHLDHTDGLFAYIQYGYLKDKKVHATPEVIYALRQKLGAYGIRNNDPRLPTFCKLEGEGWLHIRDGDKNVRLSVNYHRNATPHTARCTPFFVHGHYKGKWIGSYLNGGDARYGYHNSEEYKGPEVEGDNLNKAFFMNSNQRFVDEINKPDAPYKVDPNIAKLNPTYFDLDVTSITKKDWGPTEHEVEENLSDISYLFKDKGILLGMISTNDNRFDTALRVATRTHRDVTEFGANIEKTARSHNIHGFDHRLTPKPRNNIQDYLDDYFDARLRKKIKGQQFDFRMYKIYALLNDSTHAEQSATYRRAIMKQLGVVYHGEKLDNDLLTDREKFSNFILAKHRGKEDPLQDFLDSVRPGLKDDHPLKAMQSVEIPVTDENARSKAEHTVIRKIKRNEARLEAFGGLRTMRNALDRYNERVRLEEQLRKEFSGREATLGSVDLDEVALGSVRVGRNTRTSREIMKLEGRDDRRLVLLTGTQGTNVEVDSALSALASGHSLMDFNPEHRHTARPIIPENNVVVISQTAIPGNKDKQLALVQKLVRRHFTVVKAEHDGFKIYFSDKDTKTDRKESIIRALKRSGKGDNYEVEDGGRSLMVHKMPIHAGGHGHRKDCEAWVKLVHADRTAAQHTSILEAGTELEKLCDGVGCRYMGRIVPNFEGLSIKAGNSPEETKIDSIGRGLSSFILIETKRKTRQYHGGHLDARRFIRQTSDVGVRPDGLRARVQKDGWYEKAFARTPLEIPDRAKRVEAPKPIPWNRMQQPDDHLDEGADHPGMHTRYIHFGQDQEDVPHAAGVGRR